jgi:hypothetical protein
VIKYEYRKNWARLTQKIYEVDPLSCPKCSGKMKVISLIEEEEVIKKILNHLRLWEIKPRPELRLPVAAPVAITISCGKIFLDPHGPLSYTLPPKKRVLIPLRCSPITGRQHQIRVHLARIGYPVVGDKLYASPKQWDSDRELISRQALHAERITFLHPGTQQRQAIAAQLRNDLLTLCKRVDPQF